MSLRRIRYVSGTRADFGLMQSTLQAIAGRPGLSLDVVATGMHLSTRHGHTVREIEAAGLPIAARIEVDMAQASGAAMARNLATVLAALVALLERDRPDALLLLGDRGEMLAGALAAIHLNLPVVHVHGGERSGTVDEPVRHAISKLAHHHFVATPQSRERLVAMGERPDSVVLTGAPGLDGLQALATRPREALCAQRGIDPARGIALFVYHPVLQQAGGAGAEARALLDACLRQGLQVLALMPNADAGADDVRAVLDDAGRRPGVHVLTHLPRPEFVCWMAACDLMVGNSSSGIIEAATFGTPVVNVGSRQNLRERNPNVTDVPVLDGAIDAVLEQRLRAGRFAPGNVYGDGRTAPRIAELLSTIDLSDAVLLKTNAY